MVSAANLPEARLYLFDWSGTISNDRHLVYEANAQLLEQYGLPRVSLEGWMDGETNWNTSHYLNETYGYDLSELYQSYTEILNRILETNPPAAIYPNAFAALGRICTRGAVVEIISSHPQANLEREIEMHGLTPFISRALGSVSDKVAAIRDALDRHDVLANQTIFVGDTIQDMRAAREAGVFAVAVTHGYHRRELLAQQEPNAIIDNLRYLT